MGTDYWYRDVARVETQGDDRVLARMFLAYRRGRGVRLSYDDLRDVIGVDQAMIDRMTSAIERLDDKESNSDGKA